jgi:hypothetical protein
MSQTRTPADGGQSPREIGIEREADELVESGWCVRAGLDSFDQPSPFAGYDPDIYATRKGTARIVAVETDDDATDRHDALSEAAEARNADFYVVRVDDSGRRVEYAQQFE